MPDVDPLDEVGEVELAVENTTVVGRQPLWAKIAYDTLESSDKAYLRGMCSSRRPHKYASDCSGIDAPKFALQDIMNVIHEDAMSFATDGEPVEPPQLRYLFASEAPKGDGDAPRALMTMNGSPEIMVEDMLKTKRRKKKRLRVSPWSMLLRAEAPAPGDSRLLRVRARAPGPLERHHAASETADR